MNHPVNGNNQTLSCKTIIFFYVFRREHIFSIYLFIDILTQKKIQQTELFHFLTLFIFIFLVKSTYTHFFWQCVRMCS